MKKVLGIISLLLSATLATANSIDFDKAFKESTKIEKQIKKTSFPKQTYLITDFGAKPDTPDAPCHEAINQAIVTCCLNGGGTYNPQIEMFAHFKTKSSFHKTKRII